ncbi:polysaccharide pyruvyl transferase family protein [Ignatzschineria cameli]|uniref:Exopolysaccharide biosynthesis protein n=1 Tax=Ignatzschineria cameli TaxID=2182793 RepID=A0ABX5KY29_9GAMM|nr:polysaccharide pyruvyl transferase family protein [Ignatzschineria cameli]PWD88630.1 exopolysaccharide biosynthesis protein [Ignatzschineria cameli]PWD88792.1 exopolysaccharide biosynthesis protein [Ignatzschineria cameli]PWD90192.1 exopolysaccharide biosynthesis protein [Ignatzschineria cameli]
MTNHKNLMTSLMRKHDPLLKIIKDHPVHYLDIPVYSNIGDLLIMQGSLNFLNKNSIKISRMASAIDYEFPKIPENHIILLQDGGNLGDLYHLHQDFREKIIKKYPNNTIIILPQTIYFESKENYRNCYKLYSQHKSLHICVRDQVSQSLAEKMSKNVYLMPDMAHHLYPIKPLNHPIKETLFLSRIDKEAGNTPSRIEADTITDWDLLIGKKHLYIIKKFFKTLRFCEKHKIAWLSKITIKLWVKYTNYLIKKAVQLFSDHDKVITNRLHAHILSSLINKEHQVIDNSYGKNSTYIQQWTQNSELLLK